MCDDTVGDVDGEVIGWIARASLRHEEQVPGSVVGRASLRDGGQGNKRDCSCHAEQKILHHHISEALSALPRIYGKEGRERLSKLLQSFAIAVTLSGQFALRGPGLRHRVRRPDDKQTSWLTHNLHTRFADHAFSAAFLRHGRSDAAHGRSRVLEVQVQGSLG